MIKLKLLEVNYSYYKDKMPQETYDAILGLDPTQQKKYSSWLLNKYLSSESTKNGIDHGDPSFIVDTLSSFDKYKQKNIIPAPYNDINKFKDFQLLYNYMRDNEENFENALTDKIKAKGKDFRIIYKDEEHLVLIPLTYETAVKYGTGTGWCTSVAGSDYHYKHYSEEGTLYIHRFLNPDGSFDDTAYQLFIPNKDANNFTEIECKDEKDVDVDDLSDTFYSGLPYEIEKEIEEKVNNAGGYNVNFEIISSIYASDDNEDFVNASWSYSLMRLSHGDWDEVDSGDNSTYSSFEIHIIGKNQYIPEYKENELYDILPEFNFQSGHGLFIYFSGGITPDGAADSAESKWSSKVDGGYSGDDDDSEIEKYFKYMVKPFEINYVITNVPDVGYKIRNILAGTFGLNNREGDKEEMSVDVTEDGENKTYTIFYDTEYNFSTKDDWVSTPLQRKYDKQLDMEFDD